MYLWVSITMVGILSVGNNNNKSLKSFFIRIFVVLYNMTVLFPYTVILNAKTVFLQVDLC